MKLNEGTRKERYTSFIEQLDSFKEEFKVLKNALDVEKEVNKSNNESIKKLKDQIQSLQKDLELERPRYGGDSTRKIARDAFNQSTVSANWEGLEEHPVIKNIYQSIMDSRKDLGHSIEENAMRLDNTQPANEVFEELRSTKVIQEILDALRRRKAEIETITTTADNDRRHGNQQDIKLRDKVADIKATQEMFEFLLSETNDMFMNGMMFTIGAFATMGYERVDEGIREIIKKPKEEKKKDASTS